MVVRRISNDELYHHGVKGQRWGIRRYQNYDGRLTSLGRKHLGLLADSVRNSKVVSSISKAYQRKEAAKKDKNTFYNYYKEKNRADSIASDIIATIASSAVTVPVSAFLGGAPAALIVGGANVGIGVGVNGLVAKHHNKKAKDILKNMSPKQRKIFEEFDKALDSYERDETSLDEYKNKTSQLMDKSLGISGSKSDKPTTKSAKANKTRKRLENNKPRKITVQTIDGDTFTVLNAKRKDIERYKKDSRIKSVH